MKTSEVLHAWGAILAGRRPSLSIELTRECPLRCPGCYAYEDAHLGAAGVTLRQLSDSKGSDLVQGVLRLVDEHRPLHLSLVGGDPLVRYRELLELLPQLDRRGIHVQLVTSAFREIPAQWNALSHLSIVVSVDGLQPEHDIRRKPATYERILKCIAHSRVSIHCTITSQMMRRAGYLEEFVEFWSRRKETKRIWFSLFTPQKGAVNPEILTMPERARAIADLSRLRELYPLLDMPASTIEEFAHPPASPRDCIFASTTTTISADLKTRVTPCQFGGDPDCSQCGCIASMGLAAVGHHKLLPGVTTGQVFKVSRLIGHSVNALRSFGHSDEPVIEPEVEVEEETRVA
jgi:MoaA/NifB/PqqE/SkfB family radical SAM enzyme